MPSRVAGYQLMRPLGSSVYLGRKRPTAPMVAIKVLSPVTSRAAAVLMARLDRLSQGEEPSRQHHLVPLLDYGRKGTLFYVVTEYVEGDGLADLLEGGKLPVTESLSLIQGVAAALDWAHARGVFRHDLSPSKVLVDAEDGALLADFGLGRTSFAPVRRSCADIGAKLEQEERARRVDIQALAGLSHQLLVGRPRAVGLRSPGPARGPRDLTARGANGSVARRSPRVEAVLARAGSHRVCDFANATALGTALSDAADNDRRKGRGRRPKSPALTDLPSPPAGETAALAPTPTRSSRELPAPAPTEETVASVPAEPAAHTPRPATIPAPRVKSQAAWGEDLIARPRRLARLRVPVRYLAVAGVVAALLMASAWMLTSRYVERAGRDVITVSTAPPPTTVPPQVTPPSTSVTSAPATTVAATTSAPSTEPPPPPEPVVAEVPAPPPTSPPTTTRAAPVVTAPAPPPPTAPPVTTTSPPPPPTNPNFP